MHILDWVVLGAYVATVVGIGAWANRLQTDTEAYFLGNRGVRWWAAGLSIIATSFSAASVLAIPGRAYDSDLWYLQYQLGDVLAVVVVVVLFIPFFHKIRGLTTAYEYLEHRFDLKTRLLGSSLFILTTLLRAGALLFGAALLFSALVPTDLVPFLDATEESVVLFGIIAIVYTVAGGISAVIWTDVIQFALITGGVVASMFVVVGGTPGGWGAAFEQAVQSGKLDFVHTEGLASRTGLLTAIFGYGLLALQLFGTNQQPVQRYMTVKSPREAQKALLLGVGAGAFGVTLSLLLGVFLFLFYEQSPELVQRFYALNPNAEQGAFSGDNVLPFFIRTEVPPVITGALVSAVFAAAMSSLDSALNSTAAAATVDFFARLRDDVSERQRLLFAKIVAATAGVIGIAVGIYSARADTPLIDLILSFMGYFAGGLLGLFLLGMLTRRANGHGAFTGAIAGTLVVLTVTQNDFGLPPLYAWLGVAPVPYIWSTAIGLGVAMAVGYAVSLLGPRVAPEKLDDTTVWTRRREKQ